MTIHSERSKIPDKRIIEIYKRILELKRLYHVPYLVALRSYGIRDWTAFKKKVRKILDINGGFVI